MKPMPLKGRKTAWPADSIGPEFTPNVLNVRFKFGEARNAPGRGLYDRGPVSEAAHRLETFAKSNDVTWFLMLTEDKLYRRGNSAPADSNVWTQITGTFSPGGSSRWAVAQGEDKFFFCRGDDEIAYWDGLTANQFDKISNVAGFEGIAAGGGIKAKCLEYWNNRLIAANTVEGGTTKGNRIRWSQSGDYRKWNESLGLGAGFLDISSDGYEAIRQIKALRNNLVVYRKHSISELSATGTLSPVHIENVKVRGLGLGAPFSVGSSGDAHFFLGHDHNVWMWDGSTLTPIGNPIQEELAALTYNDALDYYFGYCAPCRFEYWLILCDPTRSQYEVFIYDYIRGYWTRDSFPNLYVISEVDIPLPQYIWNTIPGIWTDWTTTRWIDLRSGTVTSLLGGRTDSATMLIDERYVYDYYAQASIMDKYLETEDMYIESPWDLVEVVRLLLVYSYVDAQPFEVGVSFDRGRSWDTNEITPDSSGYSFTEFVRTGNVVRFRFRENNATGSFRWRSYMFEIQGGGDFIATSTAY